MPTYTYKCKSCNEVLYIFQGINDKPINNCDLCLGKLYRVITGGTGMIFKGSGFYKTDYTSGGNKLDPDQNNLSEVNKNLEKKINE